VRQECGLDWKINLQAFFGFRYGLTPQHSPGILSPTNSLASRLKRFQFAVKGLAVELKG
jgi:hypothetical protein